MHAARRTPATPSASLDRGAGPGRHQIDSGRGQPGARQHRPAFALSPGALWPRRRALSGGRISFPVCGRGASLFLRDFFPPHGAREGAQPAVLLRAAVDSSSRGHSPRGECGAVDQGRGTEPSFSVQSRRLVSRGAMAGWIKIWRARTGGGPTPSDRGRRAVRITGVKQRTLCLIQIPECFAFARSLHLIRLILFLLKRK